MKKIIILPGSCDKLSGTLVTLSLLIKGFETIGNQDTLCILVSSGSIMEKYFQEAGQEYCLQIIQAKNQPDFIKKALNFVNKQPKEFALLLDNCIDRNIQITLLLSSIKLRFSGRILYHFCHDLALSYDRKFNKYYNYWGYLLRRRIFNLLSPKYICNSHFTANKITQSTGEKIENVLYQPVDFDTFNNYINNQKKHKPHTKLDEIIKSGAKIILTVSRISPPNVLNDKNLHALIPVIVHLKEQGYSYHCVIIGQDSSNEKKHTQELLKSAKIAGIAQYFTILPPTFRIADYYKYASVVVSLAPREPFGRSVIEAIACGVPVVGSCTGGIGEILNNFAPEWMVNPNDPIACAQTIIRITEDPNTARTLTKAKSWVEKHCNVSVYAQQMMEIMGCVNTNTEKIEQIDMKFSCINSEK